MTKLTKKQNRALAAALRAEGLPRSGKPWEEAKALFVKGHGYKATARLIRSTLPPEEQDKATARKPKVEVTKAPVAQDSADAEFSRALEASVREEAAAEAEERPIPVQAQRVARGEVMRDAKGRIVSRDVADAFRELQAINA